MKPFIGLLIAIHFLAGSFAFAGDAIISVDNNLEAMALFEAMAADERFPESQAMGALHLEGELRGRVICRVLSDSNSYSCFIENLRLRPLAE